MHAKPIGGEMIFEYKGDMYPDYIRNGNAVGHIQTIAQEFCKGKGLDIGGFYGWTLPGAVPINIADSILDFDAYSLPDYDQLDYIFSSHCLEHLPDPVKALEYWYSKLKKGGVLFLYLPHPDMAYWRPENNRKHLHMWYPKDMASLIRSLNFNQVIHSERDLYWSFSVVGVK
jgi:SAM-dependent methyltransferase